MRLTNKGGIPDGQDMVTGGIPFALPGPCA